MSGPNPREKFPIKGYEKLCYLNNFITLPNIHVGDYTYYDDRKNGPEKFETNNVLYNDLQTKTKLVIGKFCAIGAETKFMMAPDHKLDGISTYPFPIFNHGWENAYSIFDVPVKGDILVGSDVWFGYNCTVRGGVKIGHGAIIATNTNVVKDVPPYAIVGGNPGKVLKMRFDDKTIERLVNIAWWDWDIEKITRNLKLITSADVEALEKVKAEG